MDFASKQEHVLNVLHSLKPDDITPLDTFIVDPVYTMVAHPPEPVVTRIRSVVEKLQAYEPDHYYYGPNQYHLTLVPLGHVTDPMPRADDIRPFLPSPGIRVRVEGIGGNKYGVAAHVFPLDEGVRSLRDGLRGQFGQLLNYSEHDAVWEELFWIGVMRFTHAPSQQLLNILYEHERTLFGEYRIERWQVYRTSSKVLKPEDSQLLFEV